MLLPVACLSLSLGGFQCRCVCKRSRALQKKTNRPEKVVHLQSRCLRVCARGLCLLLVTASYTRGFLYDTLPLSFLFLSRSLLSLARGRRCVLSVLRFVDRHSRLRHSSCWLTTSTSSFALLSTSFSRSRSAVAVPSCSLASKTTQSTAFLLSSLGRRVRAAQRAKGETNCPSRIYDRF